MIYSALHIFFYILTGVFTVFTLYLLILAITGLFYRSKPFLPVSPKKRIAVLITSFREDEVIVNTVRSATEHNYPASHFNVFVAADQLQPETIAELAKYRAQTFEVQFRTGSKARSLNFLLNKID